MKTTLSEREGNTVKLAVEVSGEELQEAFDSRLKQVAKEVRIPGFRQGKVPLVMVRQRLGDEAILVDAVEDAMGRWFATAAIELGTRPGRSARRSRSDDEVPEMGKPFGFTASVTVMPEVELGQYKGVEVPERCGRGDHRGSRRADGPAAQRVRGASPARGQGCPERRFRDRRLQRGSRGRGCGRPGSDRLRVRGGRGPDLQRSGRSGRRHEPGRGQDLPAAPTRGLSRRTGGQDGRFHHHG